MTFEISLKTVEQETYDAVWVCLKEDGSCWIDQNRITIPAPFGEKWHVTFVTPMIKLPYWFNVVGSSPSGWKLEPMTRPSFRGVSYNGWMRKCG